MISVKLRFLARQQPNDWNKTVHISNFNLIQHYPTLSNIIQHYPTLIQHYPTFPDISIQDAHERGFQPPHAAGTIKILPENVTGQRCTVQLQGMALEALIWAPGLRDPTPGVG